MTGLLVREVAEESIAAELGIEPGDRLLAVNGREIRDVIDYRFHAAEEELLLEILKPGGELWEIEVERDAEEPLGLVFDPPEPDTCGNRCVFCFVHQLPKGLRAPLYVKDEDYRLSFLYGNYVTLAGITEEQLSRILEQRLSPLYVSVHATDPLVRSVLLGRPEKRPILDVMKELAAGGIAMHAQVVLCPGLNDGEILARTVEDLAALHPAVRSLAVVPVGLTRHRRGLLNLEGVDSEYAARLLDGWKERTAALEERLGEPFLYFSDEFYLRAGVEVPPEETYGDFPQLENGVGMVRLFLEEAAEVLAAARPLPPLSALVVTGASAWPFVEEFLRELSSRTGATLTPLRVENRLFGESVTVTGLIAGKDILHALAEAPPADLLLLPEVMLKEGEGVFLDDVSPADIEGETGRRTVTFVPGPWGLLSTLQEEAGGVSLPEDGCPE